LVLVVAVSTLWTAVGLGAVTLVAIQRHLRRVAQPATGHTAACPRCSTRLRGKPDTCPNCGVPLQLFELVTAPIVAPTDDETLALPRALIRSDLCVGCGACVAVCPEPGALSMRGKLAVVDPTVCQGHGECIPACPLGAISVVRGTAANRVVVPQVDANFETSVPGLYIVGELGGRGLIKNAVNEGRVAAEHVVSVARRRRAIPASGAQPIVDVAIIGSGPSGLSAGLVMHRADIDYVVLEQGTLAETVRKYPRHKVLFAEPLTIPLYGDLWVSDASKESLLAVWEGVIARTGLRVRTGERVRQITRERGCFAIAANAATYRARAVVLALGRRGTPRRLDVPGEDLATVVYDIAEMSDFAGRRVLVVGGGDSAIESAIGLANQAGTTVTLSYRGEAFSRLKDRNRARIDAAIAAGRVTALLRSTVREIRSEMAIVDVDGTSQLVRCDDVVIRIGGDSPTALLEQLGVQMVTKELKPTPEDVELGSGDAA
jgi:thioredoxin reductase/Pyruvate/2-oxoacid:ferredoxin oxidoreductase delta subunit